MGHYFHVNGWLELPFRSSNAEAELRTVFAENWGYPLGKACPLDRQASGRTDIQSDNSVAELHAASWAIVNGASSSLSIDATIRVQRFLAFYERVERLVAAFNQAYLNDEWHQVRGYEPVPMVYGGHIFIRNIDQDLHCEHQVWAIQSGEMSIHDERSALTQEWLKSLNYGRRKPPSNT